MHIESAAPPPLLATAPGPPHALPQLACMCWSSSARAAASAAASGGAGAAAAACRPPASQSLLASRLTLAPLRRHIPHGFYEKQLKGECRALVPGQAGQLFLEAPAAPLPTLGASPADRLFSSPLLCSLLQSTFRSLAR